MHQPSQPHALAVDPATLATGGLLVPASELRARVERVQHALADAGIDVLLVAQNADLHWLCGSVCNGWMAIPASGDPALLLRRAVGRTAAETCWADVRAVPSTSGLASMLHQELGVASGTIALELDVLPAAEYLKLAARLPDARLVDATPLLRSARAVKSPWELDRMRLAAAQVERAMRAVAPMVAPGVSELDVAIAAEHELRLAGHQGVMRMRRFNGEMFFGQVAAGANAALPAALDAPLGGSGQYPSVGKGASRRLLEHGDLLVLDLMGAQEGYLSDCTRVVAAGGVDAVDDDLVAAQQWCVDVLESVAAAARPGVAASALYSHAIELARHAGHESRFMGVAPDQARFVGHGIGVEVDEYPFLAPGYDTVLEPGMVFALEPKLVFPGRAAVGVEDAFVVTGDGCEPLPAVPRTIGPW